MSKSKKPVASIAYNEKILVEVLNNKFRDHEVKFYAYIIHKGEGTGESEGKDHIHVFVEPNEGIDVMCFREDFETEEGLKTTLLWRPSKIQEWYWYTMHDEAYLKSKGLKRQYHYKPEDFKSSDPEEFERVLSETEVPESVRLRNGVESGASFSDLYRDGIVRPGNALGVKAIVQSMELSRMSEVKKDDSKRN